MSYLGMVAETITIKGDNDVPIPAYVAKPEGKGPYPGILLFHHAPGWDDLYCEWTRKFAHFGFVAICPNLYHRAGDGNPGDVAAKVRAEGGVADADVLVDAEASIRWLRAQDNCSGKVATFGTCSGGRNSFLVACTSKERIDACCDLWGGRVVMAEEDLDEKRPVSPVTLTKDLPCPLIGLFGQQDRAPSPEQVDMHEAELKKHGKDYEFTRYEEAAHGFFYYDRPAYRLEPAIDGWKRVFAFLDKHVK